MVTIVSFHCDPLDEVVLSKYICIVWILSIAHYKLETCMQPLIFFLRQRTCTACDREIATKELIS